MNKPKKQGFQNTAYEKALEKWGDFWETKAIQRANKINKRDAEILTLKKQVEELKAFLVRIEQAESLDNYPTMTKLLSELLNKQK